MFSNKCAIYDSALIEADNYLNAISPLCVGAWEPTDDGLLAAEGTAKWIRDVLLT